MDSDCHRAGHLRRGRVAVGVGGACRAVARQPGGVLGGGELRAYCQSRPQGPDHGVRPRDGVGAGGPGSSLGGDQELRVVGRQGLDRQGVRRGAWVVTLPETTSPELSQACSVGLGRNAPRRTSNRPGSCWGSFTNPGRYRWPLGAAVISQDSWPGSATLVVAWTPWMTAMDMAAMAAVKIVPITPAASSQAASAGGTALSNRSRPARHGVGEGSGGYFLPVNAEPRVLARATPPRPAPVAAARLQGGGHLVGHTGRSVLSPRLYVMSVTSCLTNWS